MTPNVKALQCPNCGGTVEVRGYAQTVNAVCDHCHSILDTSTTQVQVIQTAQIREKLQPLIPLGTRGKFEGHTFEVIGFQQRTIFADGIPYSWREYLLFNPFQGYRYLSEYDGHWTYIKGVRALPEVSSLLRETAKIDNTTFRHFQRAEAETTYVIGEFPWQVRFGDRVTVNDYVAPPSMLSSEITADETTWSRGTYIPGADIWKAFSLPGAPPAARGIFSIQPSPFSSKTMLSMWLMFILLTCGLVFVTILLGLFSHHTEIFAQKYSFTAGTQFSAPFVTPTFNLNERASSVDVKVNATVQDDAGFVISLINNQTGQAWDRAEGLDDSKATFSYASVPAGEYYLRIEPQMDADPLRPSSMSYDVRVSEGGLTWWPLLLGFILLTIPPIWQSMRAYSFEAARWRESDYGSPFVTAGSSSWEDD